MIRYRIQLVCDGCRKVANVTIGVRSDLGWKADFQSDPDSLDGWRLPQSGESFETPVYCATCIDPE